MVTLEQQLDVILINLRIISQIQINQRPIFKNNNIMIRNYYTIITSIIRTMAGESRNDIINGLICIHNDINTLRNEYIRTLDLNNPMITKFDKDIATIVIKALSRMQNEILSTYSTSELGFNAIIETYKDDIEFTSKLLNILEKYKILYRDISVDIDKIKDQFISGDTGFVIN